MALANVTPVQSHLIIRMRNILEDPKAAKWAPTFRTLDIYSSSIWVIMMMMMKVLLKIRIGMK